MDDRRRSGGPSADAPVAPPVLARFLGHLAADPSAPAIRSDAGDLSYGDLNAAILALYAQLRAQGVGQETVVALVAERSTTYVAMMLAVLRAGGAFLPVEPSTPLDRAQRMCRTARTGLVLAEPGQRDYATRLSRSLDPAPPLVLAEPQAPPRTMAAPPARRPDPGLAYVIFTSGSTGAPKGAMVADLGMNNHLLAKERDLRLTATDVVGFTAPLSFDISVWQALNGLYAGGSVAIASAETLAEPVELVDWVARHRVSILEIVPSHLAVVLDLVPAAELRRRLGTLRHLVATGEALPMPLVERWAAICPDIPLVNAYGPTECSDDVTHHVLATDEHRLRQRPPIGREIVNTEIHILDPDGRPLPDGAEGELFVGGLCVGRGYFADPRRTALAFPPDALSGRTGARLYRTGDRGVRLADGAIDYLGRRDRQVKIRGHRIELGDVEAQLLRVPGVAAAACLAQDDRLRGFVTRAADRDKDAPEPPAILAEMRRICPPFLVPQELTILPELPTGVTGKVDYRALAALPGPAAEPVRTAAPDPTDAARALIAETLGRDAIAPETDFFAAGGDSLAAMRLMALARARFDSPSLALAGFLADPTPRGLAGLVRQAQDAADLPAPIPATPGALSAGQERLWFLERLHDDAGAQLIRLELALTGPLDLDALRHAIAALVARHDPLRTVFTQKLGVPQATVWTEAELPLRIDVDPDDRVWQTRLAEASLRADAKRPPLAFAHLTQRAPERHVLRLILNHLIADGWSLQVIGEEISDHYARWRAGDTAISRPEIGYRDYVAAERQWLASDEARAHERFWRDTLADLNATDALPLDRARGARIDVKTAYVRADMTPRETAELRAMAQSAGATPFMAVLAAFYATLRAASTNDAGDLVIGIDAANRAWPGGDALVGTFVNQLPVRLRADAPAPSFRDLLALTRRACLGAYAHERLPFHKIVAAANPPRQANRFPLFQVKLTQQGGWRSSLDLPGIEAMPADLPEPAMPLDLMLDISGEDAALRLELLYRPEVLDRDRAAAWLARLTAILRRALSDPAAPVRQETPA